MVADRSGHFGPYLIFARAVNYKEYIMDVSLFLEKPRAATLAEA